jgi:hypothetical protein
MIGPLRAAIALRKLFVMRRVTDSLLSLIAICRLPVVPNRPRGGAEMFGRPSEFGNSKPAGELQSCRED